MNKYEVIETIGEGAYGVVLKCRNKETGEYVAIKRFKESEEDELVRKTTLREVKVLRMLKHETYVVHLIEAFRRKGKLYLVFEYVGCNLLDVLDSHPSGVDLEDVRRMVFTLLLGVRACHANGVIHRDIKPENLLVHEDQTLRLCDFGFARPYTTAQNDLTDYVATRWYRSPELLLGTTDYGLPSDLWAVGCIMAELLDGQALFPGESELDQLFLIQKLLGNFTPTMVETFKNNKTFSGYALRDITRTETTIERKFGRKANKKAVHLLKTLLVIDPTKRLTIDEALQHPFFEGMLELYAPTLKLSAPPVSIRPSTGDSRHARSTPSATVQPTAPAPAPTMTHQNQQFVSQVAPPINSQYVPQQAPVEQSQFHLPQQGFQQNSTSNYPTATPTATAYAQPSHHHPGHVPHPAPNSYPTAPTAPTTAQFGATPQQLPHTAQQPTAFGVSYGYQQYQQPAPQQPVPQQPASSQYSFTPTPTQNAFKPTTNSFLPPRVGSGTRRPPSQQWHPGVGGGESFQSPSGSGVESTNVYQPTGLGSLAGSRTHSRGGGDSRGNLPKLPTTHHQTGGGRGNTGNGGMSHHPHYSSRLSSNASDASSGHGNANPYKNIHMPPSRSSNRMFYN